MIKTMRRAAVLCCTLLLLTAPFSVFANTVTIGDSPVPLALNVLTPSAPGTRTQSGGGAEVDYSNCDDGYVMIRYNGGGKIKVQITRSGSKTYTYDLKGSGYEVFPLTSGNGSYSIGVFRNVSGNQYAQELSTSIDVKLNNSMLPFLYPSQYVNFNAKSETVKVGNNLASTASDQVGIVSNVYNYVIKNISYDNNKARTVQSGYLPSVDKILSSRKGICFDYAAVMASMLRSQGIPTRLEVGYVSGGAYHAWVSVYLTGVGWVNNVIYFDGKSWKLMDPTFASGAGAQYVGNGSSYSTQFIY